MRNGNRFWAYRILLALTLALTLAFPLQAVAVRDPVPVSPGETAASAAVEARCPTFLWTGVPGARGYELAVYRFAVTGGEPTLVTRASVLGDARGWTPSASDCLERGGRYAWSVAAIAGRGEELAWSAPFLFDVEAAPSLDELEQAIATIERYRTHGNGVADAGARAEARVDRSARLDRARDEALTEDTTRPVLARRPRSGGAQAGGLGDVLPGALTAPSSGITRIASEANTPTLGVPSLRVSANIALSAASNVFKYDVVTQDDVVFLWDDTVGNTALGREALSLVSGNASNNTAVGRRALQKTTGGATSTLGSYNTAIGDGALRENSTGFSNTATGYAALFSNTTGDSNTASGYQALYLNTTGDRNTASGLFALLANTSGNANTASGASALRFNTTGDDNTASGSEALRLNTTGDNNTASGTEALTSNTTGHSNTAIGAGALFSNTTGERNTAVGDFAGIYATTGDDNIFVGSGSMAEAGEGHTIRIGGWATGGATPGNGQQNRTFINGIRGITTESANAVAVLISGNGQLGTMSSSRAVKQDIQDLGPLADRLLELRPVAFRYRQHAATDPDTPLQFGLIAEEVAEVLPELVVYDADGKPETIKYHLLSSLLLGEVQRQNDEALLQREVVLEQRAEIERLDARLEAVEDQYKRATQQDADLRPRRR